MRLVFAVVLGCLAMDLLHAQAPQEDARLRALDSTYAAQRARFLRATAAPSAAIQLHADAPRITAVTPTAPVAGDSVRIVLSGISSRDRMKARLHVHMDGREARWRWWDSATVLAYVPDTLREGPTTIVIESDTWATQPFIVAPAFPQDLLTAPASSTFQPGWLAIIGVGLAALSTIVGLYVWLLRRRYRQLTVQNKQKGIDEFRYRVEQSFGRSENQVAEMAAAPASSFVPMAPDELVDACARGECVLFAGPGVGAGAGYPTRLELLMSLVQLLDRGVAERVQRALGHGDPNAAGDIIAARMPRAELYAAIREIYDETDASLSPLHSSLAKLPFTGAFTISYDDLLEKTFAERSPIVIGAAGSGSLAEALRPDQFLIVKLFGTLEGPDSFAFVYDELQASLYHNATLAKLLVSELTTKTWLFLGASIEGIAGLLSAVPERYLLGRKHYALVPTRPDLEVQADRLKARCDIELLDYGPTPGFPEVVAFVDDLAAKVHARHTAVETHETSVQGARLSSLTLTNIGPFRHLQLSFEKPWTVILGNNGSGKSSILRALALAFCGDDQRVRKSAEKLLRIGETSGSIEMIFDDAPYRTLLTRDIDGVSVRCLQFTPVQRGTATVLGFPPLRGYSNRNPSGAGSTGSGMPGLNDVFPLLTGAVDTRMDSLKQWLVNLDVNSQPSPDVSLLAAARNARLRDHFFEILRDLSPGTSVQFGKVDRQTWEVYVTTPDGLVSLDQVSQGMSSLLGWVGTALQRMHEVWPDVPIAEHCPALFLVDEIDAHLHPEWQQVLVRLLSKHFPKVQFIATTHSPLVIAGLEASEVLIAERDPTEPSLVQVNRAPVDIEGMRADQILTSPLFGLASTRSLETHDDIDRLSFLAGKESLSLTERAELDSLDTKLSANLSVAETPLQREIEAAVRKAVQDATVTTEAITPDAMSTAAMAEMRRQLSELFSNKQV
jgi:hypothetical protein